MIVFILLLSVLFRFYRFPELFHWTLDQDYWAYLPFNIATAYHFPLIGGHIAGTGLYSGPSFIYLMAIPAKIFSGDPLGFGYTVAVLGVVATLLVYYVGKGMFGRGAGMLAAFIHAGSFLVAIYDREYWNASLTPFLSLIVIWLIRKITSGEIRLAILLAPVLTLAFHAHGTGMALILFTVLSWVVFKLPWRNKYVGIAVGLFLFLQLPLVLFDLRHDYTNLRAAVKFFASKDSGSLPALQRINNVLRGFTWTGGRLVYFPAKDLAIEQTLALPSGLAALRGQPPLPATLVLAGLTIWSLGLVRKDRKIAILVLLVLSTLLGLLVYKTDFEEYFYFPTFMAVILLLGAALDRIWRSPPGKILVLFSLGLFLAGNLQNLLTVKHSLGFDARMRAVKDSVAKVGGEPFSVDFRCTGYCQIYGLRYFYSYLGVEPVRTYSDGILGWLYDKRLPREKPRKQVVFDLNGSNIRPIVKDISEP